MQCDQTQHIQRHPIRHSLQQRAASSIRMVAKALIQNEPGKNERLLPKEEGDCRETEIRQDDESEDLERSEVSLLHEHELRQVKQGERHDELGCQKTPSFVVERLTRQAGEHQSS